MMWLLLVWTVLFVTVLGWGFAIWRGLARFFGSGVRAPSLFQSFWLGYAALLAFLELWTLLFPVNSKAWMVIGVVATGGAIFGSAPTLRQTWRAISCRRPQTVLAFLGTAIFLWMVSQSALGPIGWYDTLLYHLQTVQWANRFPAVLGLANLHGRLAFNSAYLLFSALIDLGPLNGRAAHVAGGFLLSVVGGQWFATLAAPGALRSQRIARAYVLLTLPFLVAASGSTEVASLSTDLPTGLCALVTGLEIIRIHTIRVDARLLTALALGTATLVTKLGGLPLPAVAGCIALMAVARQQGERWRALLGLALVPAALLVGYVLRSVIQSGWLLYPLPIARLPFSWAVPRDATEDMFRWIQSWARIPGKSPPDVLGHGFMHWFIPWYSGARARPEFLLLATSFAAIISQVGASGARLRHLTKDGIVWGWVMGFAALLNWFFGAPDLRFGVSFFWLLFGVAVAPAIAGHRRSRAEQLTPLLAVYLCHSFATIQLPVPAPELIWHVPDTAPVFPTTRVTLQRIAGRSFTVRTPAGDNDRCGNAPLPCAPIPGTARMREPGNLRAGFTAK